MLRYFVILKCEVVSGQPAAQGVAVCVCVCSTNLRGGSKILDWAAISVLGSRVYGAFSTFPYSSLRPAWLYPKIIVLTYEGGDPGTVRGQRARVACLLGRNSRFIISEPGREITMSACITVLTWSLVLMPAHDAV